MNGKLSNISSLVENSHVKEMNSESVIHLVRAHAELYDPSHPNHQNDEHITNIWRIIAHELGPNISGNDTTAPFACPVKTGGRGERTRIKSRIKNMRLEKVVDLTLYLLLRLPTARGGVGEVFRAKVGNHDTSVCRRLQGEDMSTRVQGFQRNWIELNV